MLSETKDNTLNALTYFSFNKNVDCDTVLLQTPLIHSIFIAMTCPLHSNLSLS